MRVLHIKLLRNLGSMKGQITAIVLIIACGVASFVTVVTAYRGLEESRDAYYRRYRMADVFAPLKRAPRSVLHDLEEVAGVRRVEGRIVFEVTIDLPDLVQPASGRIISVPDRRGQIVNDLHLTRGRWFTTDGDREVIVSDRFAELHGLEVGDVLRVVMNDKKEALRIVGRALTPEFVYLIRGGGEFLPDPKHFTILWLSESFAEAAFDFEDACNDVVATLSRNADAAEVIRRFDDRLDRYGGAGAYEREDQLSNRFLSDEIDGLRGSATMVPAIFLGVAAFVLHVLMGRLVRTQRAQIAILRAFGYATRDLVVHFLQVALLVGVLGAVLGIAVGLFFARYVLGVYREFFDLPVLAFGVDGVAVGAGLLVSIVFSALGALGALRAAARLDPAEGLRPASPHVYHRTFLERLGILWRRLGFATRMILRNISRTKVRATVTISGVALAASILLLSFFGQDAMEVLMDTQFRLVDREDARVTFFEERGREALYEIRRLEGVRRAEAELIVGVRLRNGWRSRRTGITGLDPDHSLVGLLDRDLRPVALPRDGLLLSRKLADLLGLRVGDVVDVEVLYGRKQRFRAPIESVVDEYLGVFAYARLDTLSRWIGEEDVLTGARLIVDPDHAEDLGAALKDQPTVASVSFKSQTVRNFRETIARSQDTSNTVLILFAGIIAFGVLYNAARISLSERERELGSLRVLGFNRREVGAVLAGENLLLAVLALIPGLGLGAFFAWLLTRLYETDLYRFPFVIHADSVLWTILVILFFAALANAAVIRRLNRMDVVEVLKARE
jgi:putative ABC transport system permease protein